MNRQLVRNAIMGGAIGDALGVPVEFDSPESLEANPVRDMREYGTHNQPAGTWSDDTSQVLVCMDSVIRTQNLTTGKAPEFWKAMREGLQHWYFNGGYTPHGEVFDNGRVTAEAIHMMSEGQEWPGQLLRGNMDSGNGALMRLVPFSLALYTDNHPKDVDPSSTIGPVIKYTLLTHGSEEAKLASIYLHLVVGELLRLESMSLWYRSHATMAPFFNIMKHFTGYAKVVTGGDSDRFRELVSRLAKYIASGHSKHAPKASGYVMDTLASVVWALVHGCSFTETVLSAVNLGGDADTIGSIAGQLAGITFPPDEGTSLPWELDLVNWSFLSDTADNFAEVIGL